MFRAEAQTERNIKIKTKLIINCEQLERIPVAATLPVIKPRVAFIAFLVLMLCGITKK